MPKHSLGVLTGGWSWHHFCALPDGDLAMSLILRCTLYFPTDRPGAVVVLGILEQEPPG